MVDVVDRDTHHGTLREGVTLNGERTGRLTGNPDNNITTYNTYQCVLRATTLYIMTILHCYEENHFKFPSA
jgi:hypothetical protein